MHDAFGDSLPIGEVKASSELNGHHWQAHDTDSSGVFDFKNGLVTIRRKLSCVSSGLD